MGIQGLGCKILKLSFNIEYDVPSRHAETHNQKSLRRLQCRSDALSFPVVFKENESGFSKTVIQPVTAEPLCT